MKTQKWVAVGILALVLLAGGTCWAETVNINPYRIVLNAQGAFDDVQANVPIFLEGSRVSSFDVTLVLDEVQAKAESAYYCVVDNMLIIGFDRAALQMDLDAQDMGNTIVTATVTGTVTMNTGYSASFSGSDTVEIVAPGAKGKK